MAKGQKTGGRVAGTPNRATLERQAIIAETGMTPLEFMLLMMRGDYEALGMEETDITPTLRMKAAGDAAPYVHPKLHAIEHKQRTAEDTSPSFTWLPPT